MTDTLIDAEVFAELQETTGEEFAAELLTTFLDEAPRMIAELKTAADQQDQDGIRRAAHSLKSNANVFGATALAQIAKDIELNGLAPGPLTENAVLEAFDVEFARTSSALEALLDG
ncbi:Hpt domain-containing protein [Seohaeicola saemankumensis]|nr:Hpt domain-containing protein [Seohaeicola saemankumensis]MCA0873912.1 Hpt domain-containing protein [Seohaeicola saemankumensis]